MTAESTEYLRLADQRGDLRQLYAALDVLGSTCWTVNGRVLDVLIQAWNDNLSIGKLIPRQTKSIPEMPSLEELDEAARKKEKRKWTKKVADIERENGDNYSNRVSAAYTLQQALMVRSRLPFVGLRSRR